MLRMLCHQIKSAVKSILFFRRQYYGVIAGTLLAAMLLTGSLLIGDSVKQSLAAIAADRLGRIEYALESKEGFFTAGLAGRLESKLKTNVIPVLRLTGVAETPDGRVSLPEINVLGVPDDFVRLFRKGEAFFPSPESLVLAERTAKDLGVRPGDEIIVKVQKKNYFPAEVPFGKPEERFFSLRLTVASVKSKEEGGTFSLNANQTSPQTVFLPLATLGDKALLEGRANLLLVAARPSSPLAGDELERVLKESLDLADYGIRLRYLDKARFELVDERIFIRSVVRDLVRRYDPAARPHLSYFANSLESAGRFTPYSFVAALDDADLPFALGDNGVIVNDWLASDLGLAVGSPLAMSYYAVDEKATLVEKKAQVLVKGIFPVSDPVFDSARTPDFPGITEVENCRDWTPGVPLDLGKIRVKDELYWYAHRAAPKAVISLAEGKALWSNRFGSETSLRFQAHGAPARVEKELLNLADPSTFGLAFQPVKSQSLRAVAQGVDFTGLFTGLSFIAILAGLLVASFLFSLAVLGRSAETALLGSIGFRSHRVFSRMLIEGGLVALLASVLGSLAAVLYTRLMIVLLHTLFQGAIGEASIEFYFSPVQFSSGVITSFLFSLLVLGITIFRQARRPILELFTGAKRGFKARRFPVAALLAGLVCFIAAIVVIASGGTSGINPLFFFISSGLVFVSLLSFIYCLLVRFGRAHPEPAGRPLGLAVRELGHNPRRTVMSILIIALGVFLVAAVGANTSSLPADYARRDTGTGGFSLYEETSVPVVDNLNDTTARKRLGLDGLEAVFVPLRLKEGDDASCLNLNRAQSPEILGVPAYEFASRGAFGFASRIDAAAKTNPWLALEEALPDNMIPAIADEESLTWALGLSVGDIFTVRDEEGGEHKLKFIAGLSDSIFQGSLLISERNFLRLFPSTSGYARFLIDTPEHAVEGRSRLTEHLADLMRNFGARVMTTEARLFGFQQVANTYLLMFLLLGGLGLLIGIAGFGVLIMRNIAERRGELALLAAVGFEKKTLFRILLAEKLIILFSALAIGLSAAGLALAPVLLRAGERIPWVLLGLVVFAMIAGGFLSVWGAVRSGLKGDIIGILKNE